MKGMKFMKLDKYKITTVIFILFIGYIGIATFWNNKEEFISIIKSGDIINKTNQIYAENVAHSDFFIDLWSQTQSASNATLLDDAEYGVIVKDSLGSLYFPVTKKDVTNQAQSLVNFSKIIKEKVPNCVSIFIAPPSFESLKERLVGRNTEPADVIEKRLIKAEDEISSANLYDYIVINEDVEEAANEVISIIESEHLRVDRVLNDYYKFIWRR